MSSGFTIKCPGCNALMRPPGPVPSGKKVKCGKCGNIFVTGAEKTGPAATPPARPKPPVAAPTAAKSSAPRVVPPRPAEQITDRPVRRPEPVVARKGAEIDDDEPVGRRASVGAARRRSEAPKKVKVGNNLTLVVGLAVGGVGLVAAASVGAVLLLRGSGQQTQAGANQAPPAQTEQAAVTVSTSAKPLVPAQQTDNSGVTKVAGDGAIPAAMLQAIKNATVFLKVSAGSFQATGSGFVMMVDGKIGYVVTNNHVVSPPEETIVVSQPEQPAPMQPRAGSRLNPRFGPRAGIGSPRAGIGPRFGPRLGPWARQQQTAKVTIKPTISAVFYSGTPNEKSFKAEVLSAEEEVDLAILRVVANQELPQPIDVNQQPKLVETMPVFIVGFPFGADLARNNRSPEVTINRGSVSSMRLNDRGELAMVQIDGALNPGNSGGPVVDAEGRLVGISVAKIKDSGIGFAIPPGELAQMLQGRLMLTALLRQSGSQIQGEIKVLDRLHKVHDTRQLVLPGDGSAPTGEVFVGAKLIDPLGKIPTVEFHYTPGDQARAIRANADGSWSALAGVETVALKTEEQFANAVSKLPLAGNEIYSYQFSYRNSDGKTFFTQPQVWSPEATATVAKAPSPPPNPGALPGAATTNVPSGAWTEFKARDNSFTVLLPEGGRRFEGTRQMTVEGVRLRINVVSVDAPDGLSVAAFNVAFPAQTARQLSPQNRIKMMLDGMLEQDKGTLVGERDILLRSVHVKEYQIQNVKGFVRARIFASNVRVFAAVVAGTRGQIDSPGATKFLESFKLQSAASQAPAPNVAGGAPKSSGAGKSAPGGKQQVETNIVGGHFDKPFRDEAPPGGVMIGFQLGFGSFAGKDVICALRPIYRTPEGEVLGEQHGTDMSRQGEIKAKDGYAVGIVQITTGLMIHGFSITFQKVGPNGLVESDSYESDWTGGPLGGQKTRLGGKGYSVVGINGKANDKDCTGLGLILRK